MSETGLVTDVADATHAVPRVSVTRFWERTSVTTPVVALALAVTVAASLVLRFWHINHLGYNSDEAVYAGQGASIAGVPELNHLFPIFRAHPLLFQTIVSIPFALGGGDVWGRLLAAVAGLATIYLTYRTAFALYGRRAGVVAAVLIALMPYHVLVSRQLLLDGPETLFATLTLFLLARYALTHRPTWLYAAGGAAGLTFLSKEVGILFVGSVYAFLALAPAVRVRLRDVAISLVVMAVVIVPYPLSLVFAGKTHTGSQFLSYQLFRRPNHSVFFYPTTVAEAIGPAVLVAAVAGLVLMRRYRTWRETLLLSWIVVPALFFELYPVKGFQYLLPIAPPIAILAARTLALWPEQWTKFAGRRQTARALSALATVGVAVTLAIPAWGRIQPPSSGKFLAGSGGVPGGREAGGWIRTHIPVGAEMLAIGPSMANILQFYGHRKVFGLSVSPNPLRRNPVYEPVVNPDLEIRHNDLQYLIWDSYSASRSTFFAGKILRYADRYNGRVVHVESVAVKTSAGGTVRKPVIVVYAVRP